MGLVKARAYLEQLGAELVETSMLIGDSAYDVEPGWLGIPAGAFAEFAVSDIRDNGNCTTQCGSQIYVSGASIVRMANWRRVATQIVVGFWVVKPW